MRWPDLSPFTCIPQVASADSATDWRPRSLVAPTDARSAANEALQRTGTKRPPLNARSLDGPAADYDRLHPVYNGVGMYFEILGEITEIEVIATGHGIDVLKFLRKRYGAGQWRKLKGIAKVRKRSGSMRWAEVHWYEAHGIGRKGWKIKRFLD